MRRVTEWPSSTASYRMTQSSICFQSRERPWGTRPLRARSKTNSPPRHERSVHARKQVWQRIGSHAFVEQVVEHLADGDHGATRRQLGIEQRCANEFPRLYTLSSQANHGRRLVDTEHSEPGSGEQFRRNSTAAPEINDQTGIDTHVVQASEDRFAAVARPVAERCVMDERQVRLIAFGVLHSRIS